jgi:hypothetical protein
MSDAKQPLIHRPVLVAILGMLGASFFGLVVPWMLLPIPTQAPLTYRGELLKASLNVSTGIILTVVVAMLVEAHRIRSARRVADHELHRALISQLRNVDDQVKSAALLINAHQSARTYGEQMRRLIEVRVSLLNARHTVHAEERAFRGDTIQTQLLSHLDAAAVYLQKLTAEYQEHYLRVSRIQSYSHEWDQAQAKKAAQSDEPPAPGQMKSSTVAWTELTGVAFTRLKALLEDEDSRGLHQAEFAAPLGKAVEVLRNLDQETI